MSTDDDLATRLRALEAPAMDLPATSGLVARARTRRRRRAGAAALAALAVVGVAVPVALRGLDGPPDRVASTDPLSVDGLEPLACGVAPLSVLSAEVVGVEDADTPESAALRQVIRDGFAGQLMPSPGGWVEVVRAPGEVTFGQREGERGIGDTLTFRDQGDGTWGFAGNGGCRGISYADGRTAVPFDGYEVRGLDLVLPWSGGKCNGGPPPGPATVRVMENADVVEVLLVRPAEQLLPGGNCAGVGTLETTVVTLTAPLGDRPVVNVGVVPAETALSLADVEAEQARMARSYERCLAVATQTGGAYGGDYLIDVATARANVADGLESWSALPDGAEASQCFTRFGDGPTQVFGEGPTVASVAADGVPTVVYDPDYTANPLERFSPP